MIYGIFSNDITNKSVLNNLNLIEKYSVLVNYKIKKFSYPNFEGGIIINKKNYHKIKDFYFFDAESNTLILFSGSIYNISELKSILGSKIESHVPKLIFELYKINGPHFANGINGDFAFVILSLRENKLLLFRDHLGIVPLSYSIQEENLYFSCDFISLCKTFQAESQIASDFLLKNFKMVDYTLLPNPNVKKLTPGHFLEAKYSKVKCIKYWFPEKNRIDRKLTKEKVLSDLKKRIENAVKIRSDINLKASTHLSGGLDSGIVAAFSRKEYIHQKEFLGFSWSPITENKVEVILDERKLVNDQCNLNKIHPIYISLTKKDYLDYSNIPYKFSVFFEEMEVLKIAQDKNIDIIFSGFGGDEFVSIGNRGVDSDLFFGMHWIAFFKRYPIYYLKTFARTFLYEIIFPFLNILPTPIKKDYSKRVEYLLKEFKKSNKKTIRNFFFFRNRRNLHLGLLDCFYIPDRTENWYLQGFMHGIQYRYPLLDKNIIEYMLKVPSKFLYFNDYNRNILREISEDILPESVRWKNIGSDPVLANIASNNAFECSLDFVNEIKDFENNKDLQFINFEKLKNDIERYSSKADYEKMNNLWYTIFLIKQIHEFTKAYRKRE